MFTKNILIIILGSHCTKVRILATFGKFVKFILKKKLK